MQYTLPMKTANIPSVRVDPAFRSEIEQVLGKGESLSEFVESAVRANGFTDAQFAAALRDLDMMHMIMGELDSLP